jgi:hypothetical protein
MRHPDANALALHAGGDLTGWNRWRVDRHLRNCETCRDEVTAIESVREMLPGLTELPQAHWESMAAEMTANIRLGLEAGECVRKPEPAPARYIPGIRPALAAVALAALAIAAVVVERPRLIPRAGQDAPESLAVQTAPDGIGNQEMKLMYHGAQDVQVSASAAGSVAGRYTDPDTGVMTVIQIDGQ